MPYSDTPEMSEAQEPSEICKTFWQLSTAVCLLECINVHKIVNIVVLPYCIFFTIIVIHLS